MRHLLPSLVLLGDVSLIRTWSNVTLSSSIWHAFFSLSLGIEDASLPFQKGQADVHFMRWTTVYLRKTSMSLTALKCSLLFIPKSLSPLRCGDKLDVPSSQWRYAISSSSFWTCPWNFSSVHLVIFSHDRTWIWACELFCLAKIECG